MDKLISKEEAIETLGAARPISWTDYGKGYNDGIDFAVSKLSALPSVDIVQCKECKFASYEPYEDHVDVYVCNYSYWTRAQGGREPDWYCKRGKRREDATN